MPHNKNLLTLSLTSGLTAGIATVVIPKSMENIPADYPIVFDVAFLVFTQTVYATQAGRGRVIQSSCFPVDCRLGDIGPAVRRSRCIDPSLTWETLRVVSKMAPGLLRMILQK